MNKVLRWLAILCIGIALFGGVLGIIRIVGHIGCTQTSTSMGVITRFDPIFGTCLVQTVNGEFIPLDGFK